MPGLSSNARRLARQLFPEDAEAQARLLASLEQPQTYRPAVLWTREREQPSPFVIEDPVPWQPSFVDRLAPDQRPGQHPLHEAGAYYCLDMSSVFAATVLTAVNRHAPLVIDTCAAPGGKSVFAWRQLQPDLLVANEVIRKRCGALISNFTRCGIQPALISSMDTAVLAGHARGTADVVIVDAPCSGQSLLAKGVENAGCFHPSTINLNANRQRRILANAAELLAPGGCLAYLTCTYAEKENEGNARWLMKQFPALQPVEVTPLQAHRSHLAGFPCYRLWPWEGIGAGAFAVLLQRADTPDDADRPVPDLDALRPIWRS